MSNIILDNDDAIRKSQTAKVYRIAERSRTIIFSTLLCRSGTLAIPKQDMNLFTLFVLSERTLHVSFPNTLCLIL